MSLLPMKRYPIMLSRPGYLRPILHLEAGHTAASRRTFSQTVSHNGAYYIVVPIGKSGIGFLGDAGKFVSLGKKRISALSDDGAVRATVSFAPNEPAVQLHGYAPSLPTITATEGSVSDIQYDPTTQLFTATVAPGPNGVAHVEMRPNPGA